ncbi:MAG TPA: endonuclease NucS [Thermodesulfobacteriota bacterium]|nr:endonuclease NucS [Thermodesulfobacteriota bacterium]
MNKCPLCSLINTNIFEPCSNCGYNFEKEKIGDEDKLRAFLGKLRKSKNWIDEVKFKNNINTFQRNEYGRSSTNPEAGGWSERKTAGLLGETHVRTSSDIRLAEGLEQFPELLLECKNKTSAQKRLKAIRNEVHYESDRPTFKFEKDFQKCLNANWEETPFHEEWELQKTGFLKEGKYNTGEIGELDLLAKHRKEERWLVVELKREQSSDETVGQILRYMGWVKKNLAGENGKVQGFIISETTDARIRYALVCVPDISLKVYRFENGKPVFKDAEDVYLESMLKKLSPEQTEELIRKLKEQR